ncbi:RaxX family RiPP [Xanthomonas translucens]|uniref:RaxX family RiPP n=1 Tax=Xanthomonas campestris pv. translucens TaxID=343 RepID=UPI002ECFCBAD
MASRPDCRRRAPWDADGSRYAPHRLRASQRWRGGAHTAMAWRSSGIPLRAGRLCLRGDHQGIHSMHLLNKRKPTGLRPLQTESQPKRVAPLNEALWKKVGGGDYAPPSSNGRHDPPGHHH